MRRPSPASRLAGPTIALSVAVIACATRVPASPLCDGEADRARAVAARIEQQWPMRGADDVTTFMRELGRRLARRAPTTSGKWAVVVLRSRAANAFAVGNGLIYVTDGALDACDNEAELAAMLAHEMGHQVAGHFCQSLSRDARSAQIGSLVQHIDPAKEREADRIAVEILEGAGYDPRAALTVARRLGSDRPPGRSVDPARIEALARLVAAAPATGDRDSEAFRRLKRKNARDVDPVPRGDRRRDDSAWDHPEGERVE